MGAALNGYSHSSSDPNQQLTNETVTIHGQRYTLLKKLGAGGFGSVWSAVSSDGHPVAIKAIDVSKRGKPGQLDSTNMVQSFQKEVKMAYKMRQETRHIVTIYGFDFDPRRGLALMAMELGGDTLQNRIEILHGMKDAAARHRHFFDRSASGSEDYISTIERKNIWFQLNNIVQTLHRYRVVHRDMKPENLVFFGPIMKIVDLGIAQKEVIGYDPNVGGMGSPGYSAPECFRRHAHVTSKADVWSAGAILYRMTYGIPPPHPSGRPPHGSYGTRSASVGEILDRCLRFDPQQRAPHNWLAHHPYTNNRTAL